MATPIAGHLAALTGRIDAAARRAGRAGSDVVLIGVSKTHPAERINEAIGAGLKDVGENKVQEARDKIPGVVPGARWHLVGHLQGNKANLAVRLFDVIHSIDSIEILERLERGAAAAGRRLTGLVQVDLAREATKSGAPVEEVEALLAAAEECRAIEMKGLMILPPYADDPEASRPWFRSLRTLRDEAQARHPRLALRELSMGMSEDFEVAVEEGATMVRVGRALFGERQSRPQGH